MKWTATTAPELVALGVASLLSAKKRSYALFLREGQWLVCTVGTARAEKLMSEPEAFVGTYAPGCDARMISEDMRETLKA